MTYTYIINIEFSHMMNDYMVDHMVHRITTSRTDTAPARLTSSSSSSARRPASRHRRQHTGHRADTYIYVICIHMHFVHAFLCIRRSTAALVHPCVQTYIRRSGAPPLLSHRPLSRPSRSTFVLRVGIKYIVVNKVTMFSLRYMMNDYMVHMVHRIYNNIMH